jgi:HEAT repeat protein
LPGDKHQSDRVTGLSRTAKVLAGTENRAVLPLFVAGMKSPTPEIRAAAIRAAIRRIDADTHNQLIRHFSSLDRTDQLTVCQAHSAMPHHAARSLKSAILKGDATLCKNACQIIELSGDVELIATLLKAAENKNHPHRSDIAQTIHRLAMRVADEMVQWNAGDRTSARDPSFKRHKLLAALEQSLGRFAQHELKQALDAFLLLAPIDNRTLNRVMHDTAHACHKPMVDELSATQDAGIIARFVEMLRDTDAPTAALNIIAQRTDQPFVSVLLTGLKRPVPIRVLHNMKRLTRVAWLEERRDLLVDLDGRTQAVAIELAMSCEMNRTAQFELLVYLMQNGLTEARRACCQALAKFEGAKADEVVIAALEDPDAGVQATAIRQLRARSIPNALQRLVALLDSRSPEVREAARSSLAEFNFTRYRTMFDLLDEQSAHTTGVLVHKVDHSVPQKLIEELTSPSITNKLRGIDMAVTMEATGDVRQQLVDLARHENLTIRKEAITALAHCKSDEVIALLMTAATDPHHTIAEAAQASLAKLGLHPPNKTAHPVAHAGKHA